MSAENPKDPAKPILVLEDIVKNFGANRVLKGVTLDLRPGKITALLGANGAGKSTLIKILSGVYNLTGGKILIEDELVLIDTPMDANRAGLRTVHQRIDDSIVPGLSVAENLIFEQIADGSTRSVSSLKSILPNARKIAETLNLGWDDAFLKKDAYELSIAEAQMLLLARALYEDPQVLILDEPTSTLSQAEANRLFEIIERMRRQGVAILYVSHRMGEIKALADDIAVLRDGRVVDRQQAPFDLNQAVKAMLGEDIITEMDDLEPLLGGEVVLEIENHKIFDYSPPLNLSIREGEVTVVIGLIGAGKTELLENIFGAAKDKNKTGTMRLGGEKYHPSTPKHAIKAGIFMVPEDRAAQSMLPGWSIEGTYTLPFLQRYVRRMVLDKKKEFKAAAEAVQEFNVVTSGPKQPVDALSGGNQQKVVVARWMQEAGRVLILDEPFRGVDLGARREIGERARNTAKDGASVIVAVSDVNEAREIADRIVVLVEGRIALDRRANEVTNQEIIESMTEDVENE